MSKILDNLDYGKAFESFKADLDIIDKNYKTANWSEAQKKSWKLGALETAVNKLLIKCTGESIYTPNLPAADPDDLKYINI